MKINDHATDGSLFELIDPLGRVSLDISQFLSEIVFYRETHCPHAEVWEINKAGHKHLILNGGANKSELPERFIHKPMPKVQATRTKIRNKGRGLFGTNARKRRRSK